MSLLDPVINTIRTRLTRLERSHPKPREGRVTQAYPMQVRLDGDSVDTPVRQIATASVGSRVLCMKLGFRYYMIGQVGGQGPMLLDDISMTGEVRNPYSLLSIPEDLQGTFRRYELVIKAGFSSTTSNVQPLVVRPNSDTGNNYRYQARGFYPDGTTAGTSNTTGAFPRTGYCGEYEGNLLVTMVPRSLGDTGFMHWNSTGWSHHGSVSDSCLVVAGGRWSGSTQRITHFQLNTNSSGHSWNQYSTAQLWGYR